MSFAAGYMVGRNAEASAQALTESAAHFQRILDSRQYRSELEWCYARIAQLESCADYAYAAITKLEADADYSRKWVEWAKGEMDRLNAEGARLTKQLSDATARVRELETAAEAQRVAVVDNIRRALRDDDDRLIPF